MASAIIPQGSSLRSGLCSPAHHHLFDPICPTARPLRVSPCGLISEVLRPAYGSAGTPCQWFRALTASPCEHAVLFDPGVSDDTSSQTSVASVAFALQADARHRSNNPIIPQLHSTRDPYFEALWFTIATACSLASLPGGSTPQLNACDVTETFTPKLWDMSVALHALGYDYNGIWAPPLAGLAPAGKAASVAARLNDGLGDCAHPLDVDFRSGANGLFFLFVDTK